MYEYAFTSWVAKRTGWSKDVPVGNICGARSQCWLNSYPGDVLRFRSSKKEAQVIQSVFGALHFIRYLFTSANQDFFLKRGRVPYAPPAFYNTGTFTHSLHSECAPHLCWLLLLLLLSVIQMTSVTRRPATGYFHLLVAKKMYCCLICPTGKAHTLWREKLLVPALSSSSLQSGCT